MTRRDEQRQAQDAKRREAKPWRAWYATKAWFIRRSRQLKHFPFCAKCLVMGMTRKATVVDHVLPHRGDRRAFFHGEVQSLCKACHDSAKQREEGEGFAREIGNDGWPTDPKHPFNRPR